MKNNQKNHNEGKNSQIDWLEFALEVLVTKGPDSLKIIPLCELKGVTKGSFYHHFQNRDKFIDALMEHWYQKMTLDFIAQANTQESALDRLNKLDQVIASHNILAEMHIRAWALKDKSIAQHLGKIDQQRQDYLANCYLELGVEEKSAKEHSVGGLCKLFRYATNSPYTDVRNRFESNRYGIKSVFTNTSACQYKRAN